MKTVKDGTRRHLECCDTNKVTMASRNGILFDVGTDVDYPLFNTVFSTVPYDDYDGSQNVAVAYKENYETSVGEYKSGYLINALDLTDDAARVGNVTVYYWVPEDHETWYGEIEFLS